MSEIQSYNPADASAFFPFITWDEHWRVLSRELWAENGGHCFYCGFQTEPGRRHIDHVIPKHRYRGLDAKWNLVPACQSCNASKGTTWPTDWVDTHLFRWIFKRWTREERIANYDRATNHIAWVRNQVAEIEQYHLYLQELRKENPHKRRAYE